MEFTTMNGSSLPVPLDGLNLTLGILSIIISLGGLVANAVVLWLLGFRLRRNSFSVYILNLAGVDFLILFLDIIFDIINILFFVIEGINLEHPIFSVFFSIIWMFVYITDLSILSCISTERCLAVMFPIWYRCRRPRHMSNTTCALLWTLSLLLTIIETVACDWIVIDFTYCQASDFFLAAWLIFLFMVLLVSSLALLAKMFSGSQRKKLTRLYVTIMLTVLLFFLCGLPCGFEYFLFFWVGTPLTMLPSSLSQLLLHLNSSANPVIYYFVGSFRKQQQRPTLKMILQRVLQDTPEVEETGEYLPKETKEMSKNSVL
ncbi:mas-related G-protein coupled receptor member X2-like [Rhynchocyon petersi]